MSTFSDEHNHIMGTYAYPSRTFCLDISQAVFAHNDAVDLAAIRRYGAAEQLFLKALELKIKTIGENGISTALSRNALGKLYIDTDRLDDAEKHLELAVKIRNADNKGPTWDAAVARENLAMVYEMRGDLAAAKQMRKSTGRFACGNQVHPILTP